MKKLIIVLLTIFVVLPAIAIGECKIQLKWLPQENTDNIAGYMIFYREKGSQYDYNAPAWEGDSTFLNCTIDGLDKSKTYYFTIRSVDEDDNQSNDSPEVKFTYNSSDDGVNDDTNDSSDAGSDAGVGGDMGISSRTNFSSCFLQTLSGPNSP
jgi:hypothetical protein